jgi:flagellar protein FlaG
MSTSINTLRSSVSSLSGDLKNYQKPSAASVPVKIEKTSQVSQLAEQNFAKKAEVGQDLQALHQSIEASVDRLNTMMKDTGRNLNIGMDRVLGGPVVTVRNAESGEVIRQIPNEVVVKMAHSIEAFKGWLHDGSA